MIESVFLGISQDCNQNCIFCSNPKICDTEQPGNGTLSFEETTILIKSLKATGVDDLRLYGGEPFMNREILKIMAFSLEQGMKLSVYTNGTFADEPIREFLRRNSIRKMFISLDGSTAKIHDAVRQTAGAFEQTIENIKTFINLGVTIDILFTICSINKNDIFETYHLIRELGARDIKSNLVSPVGMAKKNWEKVRLDNKEVRDISQEVLRAHQFIFGKEPKRKECQAGNKELFIASNGDIYPCAMFIYDEYKIGNIRQADFSDIISVSPIIKEFAQMFKYGLYCGNCRSKVDCHGGCRARAYANHKNLLKPDFISCLINKGGSS
jgi:radical SAM protein with 4Fe4S-binding SPASM domain